MLFFEITRNIGFLSDTYLMIMELVNLLHMF